MCLAADRLGHAIVRDIKAPNNTLETRVFSQAAQRQLSVVTSFYSVCACQPTALAASSCSHKQCCKTQELVATCAAFAQNAGNKDNTHVDTVLMKYLGQLQSSCLPEAD